MNATGDRHWADPYSLSHLFAGEVVDKNILNGLPGLLFKLIHRPLKLLPIFFQILQGLVANIRQGVSQGHGGVDLVANSGIQTEGEAIFGCHLAFTPLVDRHSQLFSNFVIRRLATQFLRQGFANFLPFFVELLPAAGNLNSSTAIAQKVQHFAANVRNGKGAKGTALIGVKAFNGAN
jgi:hypothetical protein